MSTTKLHPKQLTAADVLGGEAVLHATPSTFSEWSALVHQGLPVGAFEAAVRISGITRIELAVALQISLRTLAQQKKVGRFNQDESWSLVSLAHVIERAIEVFENQQAAIEWLKTPSGALGGVSPLSLMAMEFHTAFVMSTLGRIEHGVFS